MMRSSLCPKCKQPFQQDAIGRQRRYCSDACKQAAYRDRQPQRPAQRQRRDYNTVRTDHLETRIAFYVAQGRHDEADAIRWIARDVRAPIDDASIAALVQSFRNTL